MSSIFVIDKAKRANLGVIDFIPIKEERIALKALTKTIECVVCCVMYMPDEHGILVFVDIVEPYYSKMVSEIRW